MQTFDRIMSMFTKTEEEQAADDAFGFGTVLKRVCDERDRKQAHIERLQDIIREQRATIKAQNGVLKQKDEEIGHKNGEINHLRNAHAYVSAQLEGFRKFARGVEIGMTEGERVLGVEPVHQMQPRIDQMQPRPAPVLELTEREQVAA